MEGLGPLDPNSHFGSPIKNQSYMPENYLQNKEFTWVSRDFYLDLHIKFLKRKCLGSSRPAPPTSKKYESKWLNEYNLNKPKFYLRYVHDILAAFDKEQDSLKFLNFLNKRHPNNKFIKFTIAKQINHSIAFLDVFISGINNQNLTLQTYHKSTYTGLLLNFKSFTSFSYKISLIKCLIDRSYKICNSWNSFHNDIENIKSSHIKNTYPPLLIDKVIKYYLHYKFSSNQNQLKDTSDVHYCKLPYIGNL